MQIPISTKLEEAWYVDPELMASSEPDPDPFAVRVEGEGEPRANETMQLGEADLEEACAIAAGITVDDTARHYQSVSLRGALLALDEEAVPGMGWHQELVARIRAHMSRRREGPPPPPMSFKGRVDKLSKRAVKAIEHLEQGRVPPVRLAVISFSAGVATTLVGVLLAL